MGIDTVTSRAHIPGAAYIGPMDRATTDHEHYNTPLARRFRAAGIPVPPPLTDAERTDWERRKAEADALPRTYGPRRD